MIKRLRLALVVLLAACTASFAQTGILKGKVVDKISGETLPFASVSIDAGGSLLGNQSNFDGEYSIKPIPPGKYTVKAVLVGYTAVEIPGVVISADKTTYVDIKMAVGQDLKAVEIVEYTEPLIDPDTKSGGSVTREEFKQMATKNISSVASTTAGVYQADEGSDISIRGSRGGVDRNGGSNGESSVDIYIDGERVRGSSNIPQQSVEQVSVITGGLPAQYGDATGGVINVTTRGPQSQYFGGVELISSQLTDAYDYNFAGFSVGGPILMKRDTVAQTKKSILGFIISGEVTTEKDRDPSAIGAWKVKDSVLTDLENNPLRISPLGQGTLRNAEFLRVSDLEHVKAKQNRRSNEFRLNGKLDFQATKNLTLTAGGSIDYIKRNTYLYETSLLNYKNNPGITYNTWRVYGRIVQKFGDDSNKDEKSASNISNAFYTLQAGYQKTFDKIMNDNHGTNFFNYGYVGKFETFRKDTFEYKKNDVLSAQTGSDVYGWHYIGQKDTLVEFTADTVSNPMMAKYTQQYYGFYADAPNNYRTLNQIRQGGGLLNGDTPPNIYSLWNSPGYTGGSSWDYFIRDQSQFRVFTNFSADIKNHSIQVGFEYEQRVDRGYQLGPYGLWQLARQHANSHIQQLDVNNPQAVYAGGFYQDTILYSRLVQEDKQSYFDKNLREKVGAKDDEIIDVDALAPSTYTLDMFSPDELINNGNGPSNRSSSLSYFGYDYVGNKLANDPTFEDYFTKKDANGNFTREIGAFKPIYMAGYIQDKFDFKDIKFLVGVRVDRFDANQKVLKDPFSLYETVKAGELEIKDRPSNIGDDYVVYVKDVTKPSADEVVGYRKGNKWYDSKGTEIIDPGVLARQTTTGKIAPFLVDPTEDIQKENFVPSRTFKDYVPQINFMPRIAFNFPISDVASFFAHYDVLTQRPSRNLRLDPADYYFMQANQGGVVNNPNLRPERTTDYELGFEQVLSDKKNSKIRLSAFYREMRDMIQITSMNYAYPVTYLTYGNLDFGTVKGFMTEYDLRRTGNVRLNASYQLQFAEGTGSSATEGYNLVNSGQPNLRTLQPLEFDQRHTIVGNFDYRYFTGSEYNGPVALKSVLQGMGANLTFRAGSGVPYSRQQNVTQGDPDNQNVVLGISQRANLKGMINGSRLPWQYRFDLRVEKNLEITFGKKGEEDAKTSNLGVYVQVLNLLNAKNIINVYRYTGNAGDDAFLTSPLAAQTLNAQIDQASYIDLYRIKVNDPNYWSVPRRIRVGVTLDF